MFAWKRRPYCGALTAGAETRCHFEFHGLIATPQPVLRTTRRPPRRRKQGLTPAWTLPHGICWSGKKKNKKDGYLLSNAEVTCRLQGGPSACNCDCSLNVLDRWQLSDTVVAGLSRGGQMFWLVWPQFVLKYERGDWSVSVTCLSGNKCIVGFDEYLVYGCLKMYLNKIATMRFWFGI